MRTGSRLERSGLTHQLYWLAEVISTVFHPTLILIVSLAIITNRYADTQQEFLLWTVIGSLLVVGPAALYTLFIWFRESKVDLDLSRREDRIVPLMLASLGSLIGSFFISRLNQNTLSLLGSTLVAILMAITIITTVWKISLHTTAMASVVTLVVLFRGLELAPLYLLLIPVAWSRVVLKQHTPAQLVGGVLAGSVITSTTWLLFRGF